MTKAEWLASDDPLAMLASAGTLSDRRRRLIASRIGDLAMRNPSLVDGLLLATEALSLAERAIDELDRFADGEVSAKRLRRSLRGIKQLNTFGTLGVRVAHDLVADAIKSPPDTAALQWWLRPDLGAIESNQAANLLRELIGNPGGVFSTDPRWRTEDTFGLARGIYVDRAFDRLPLLADALMDAGCDNERILAHCHSPGPHVRGCWVVDLVLGKE